MFVEEIERGVWKVSASEGWPRPHVGVCGSMHGNEPSGGRAIQRLLGELREGTLRPAAGTILLVQANPEALEIGQRTTVGGADLNRLWDFAFVGTMRAEAWGYEHHRALELKELLSGLDFLIDLHTAATTTPPFAVSNGVAGTDAIAKHIGVSFLVQSWYGLANKVIIGFLKRAGVPAISVECGSHDDPGIADQAHRIASSFLRATGTVVDPPAPRANDLRTVHVVETITKPSADFRFGSPWQGFEVLEPGTLVGRDRVTEIRVTRRCYAVLPNEHVDVGDDVIYLAIDA